MDQDPVLNALAEVTGQVKGLQLVLNTLLAMQVAGQLGDAYEASKAAGVLTQLRDRLCEVADGLAEHGGGSEAASKVAAIARLTIESSFNDSIGLLEKVADFSLEMAPTASSAQN